MMQSSAELMPRPRWVGMELQGGPQGLGLAEKLRALALVIAYEELGLFVDQAEASAHQRSFSSALGYFASLCCMVWSDFM